MTEQPPGGDWPTPSPLPMRSPDDPPTRKRDSWGRLRHEVSSRAEPTSAACEAEPKSPCPRQLALLLEETARSRSPPRARARHQLAPGAPRYLNDLSFALLVHGTPEAVPLFSEHAAAEQRALPNTSASLRPADFARSSSSPADASSARNNLALAYERARPRTRTALPGGLPLDPNPRARKNLAHAAGSSPTCPPTSSSLRHPRPKHVMRFYLQAQFSSRAHPGCSRAPLARLRSQPSLCHAAGTARASRQHALNPKARAISKLPEEPPLKQARAEPDRARTRNRQARSSRPPCRNHRDTHHEAAPHSAIVIWLRSSSPCCCSASCPVLERRHMTSSRQLQTPAMQQPCRAKSWR